MLPLALEVNAFGPHSATPRLESDQPGLQGSLVVLSGDAVHAAAPRGAVGVRVETNAVEITFPDGDVIRVPRS